jgi:parallel beta-helix repeat protein
MVLFVLRRVTMQRQIGPLLVLRVSLCFLALLCTLSPQVVVGTELTEDTTWSGVVVLEDTVSVPSGIVLSIEPGTVVSMKNAVAIVISGQLLAEGTEEAPIRFTRYGAGIKWKQIMFVEAADSRLTNCIFEYANCAGDHKDYYNPGPKRYQYHEAVVLVASHVDFEKCVFQNLPSAGGEGDAIAIFSDDPNHPGNASANFRSCRFLSIGQGIHTRYSYVLVEDCYFVGKTGDNDDVDLYGESTPPPLVRRNLFDMPCEDDRIHPTKCSAIITENVIKGSSSDHGIVLRDKCTPIVTNNVISNCPNGGIAVENACTAILVNNTIVNCTKGIHCFDLGRAGFPYYLTPGGGTATVINCIIWDCSPSIRLEDSPNTQAKDRGSHVTVSYCDIKGGQASISVSGTYSTVAWGLGNINIDPRFADPSNRDYHLKSQAGRWDPKSESWIEDNVSSPCIDAGDPNSDWTVELWPHGKRINMGAYGGTPQASMSLSVVGDIADLDHNDTVDANDLLALAGMWLAQGVLLAEDLNHDGLVNFRDFAKFAVNWRTDVGSEQEPFQIILGDKAKWSPQFEGYDPNLPGYHIVGDIASVTMRARADDLPETLILAIRTSPGMPPMLENFTFAAPCVMLTGEPFKGAELDYFTRDNSSVEWQGPSKVQTDTYFKFDVVGDEVHVTFLPPAIELLKVECRISWIDWYR